MTSETISQTVLFPELLDKLLVVTFDRPRARLIQRHGLLLLGHETGADVFANFTDARQRMFGGPCLLTVASPEQPHQPLALVTELLIHANRG